MYPGVGRRELVWNEDWKGRSGVRTSPQQGNELVKNKDEDKQAILDSGVW